MQRQRPRSFSEIKLQPEHADGLDLLKKVRHYRRIQLANEKGRKAQPARIHVAVLSFDEIHTNCAGCVCSNHSCVYPRLR
jgi:hypothetical protein